jgi:hypothetical protein
MVRISYQEPLEIKVAMIIYQAYGQEKKGNITSILSDALLTLGQLGPAGLELWLNNKKNGHERLFIRNGLNAASDQLGSRFRYNLNVKNFDDAWSEKEQLIRILCRAKYYAKTR